ncbi:MAG: acyl-CoA synthetase FdrA [Bacteroidota bacterium]
MSIVKGKIIKGEYLDSITLMVVTEELNKTKGVIESSVVMGTRENKSILQTSGLMLKEFENTTDNDLLVCIKAESEKVATDILDNIQSVFKKFRNKDDSTDEYSPKSFEGALKQMPDANIALISVAGKYAFHEAMKALNNGLHVMIFSDNVTIEEEIELKHYASTRNLLVMGPDCGTAIINGAPLAFANKVNRGNIGIVAASGTGLQEVSCIISNEGSGISQAIGTGGRDVKKEIGGMMFIQAMRMLNNDKATEVIALVSKPPHEDVLKKISDEIKKIKKPIVAIFIGGDAGVLKKSEAIPATTLEEAGLIAAALSKGVKYDKIISDLKKKDQTYQEMAAALSANKTKKQKYLRGLFSGGTLCDEAQLIFKDTIGYVFSNTPLNKDFLLKDSWKSKGNCVIDLGEDEFTVGRPHPMIDFSLRKKKILEEAADSDIAVLLLDVVLGYGSHLDPAGELVPVIEKALHTSKGLQIICSVTGTELDPQNMHDVKQRLENAGAIVMNSNAAASRLAAYVIGN